MKIAVFLPDAVTICKKMKKRPRCFQNAAAGAGNIGEKCRLRETGQGWVGVPAAIFSRVSASISVFSCRR